MAGYIGSGASVVSSGAENKKVFDITTNTISLTGLKYTVGKVHVYHNGVRLVDGTDYTATNSTSITLTVAAVSGDQVVVVSYASFQVADALLTSGGTMTGNLTVQGTVAATSYTGDGSNLTGVGSPSIVDNGDATAMTITSDEKIGIGTSSPSGKLELYGSGISDLPLVINHAWGSSSTALISASAASSEVFKVERNGDLTLSGGIYLGGVGSANKLDDYEEGTFSPIISGGTSAGTVTYNTRIGQYTKVGNLVTVWMNINWSSGNGSGSLMVKGLPFSVINTARPVFNVISENVSLASNQLAAGFSNFSDGIIMVRNITGTGATLTLTYDSAGTLFLTGTYPTND